MPPQFQDDDIDSFMRKRTATAPKPTPAPKSAPVADDDVDGFMSRRTGSVPTPATKKEQKAQRREQLRQSITGLQDELVARTPQPQTPRFQPPIDMRLNAPNEAQKAFDRAAAAVRPAPAQPKPELRTRQTLGQMKQQARSFQPVTQEDILRYPVTPQERRASVEASLAEGEREKQRQRLAAKLKLEEEASRASQSTLGKMGTRFARGAVRGVMQTPFEFVQMANPDPVVQQTMGRIADESKEWQSQNLPVDNRNPATLNVFKPEFYSLENIGKAATETVPEVLGEMLPQMALARGAGGVARLAAPELAAATIPRMASTTGAQLAARTAAGGYGAAQQSTQAYQKALAAGMTPEQAARAAAIEAPIGFSEFLGSPGTTGFTRPGTTIRREMREEGLQELGQTAASGLAGKYVSGYDADKPLTDIAGESIGGGLLGAATGGIVATPGARLQAYRQGQQQRATRSAIDQRSAANAAAIASQPATAQPVTEPLTEPLAAQPQPSAPATPQAQPQGFPRLPEPENFNARRAKLLGMPVPAEVGLNEQIAAAAQLLDSTNEGDQRQGRRMLNKVLTDLRKAEGYLAEAKLPPDAERPFTAVRDAIEARIGNTGKAKSAPNQATTPQVQAFNDAALGAKVDAEEAAKAGNWEAARDHYKSAMDALTEVQKIARRTKNADLLTNIGSEKSAVNALFQAAKTRANQAARTAQRQANAPTAGLPAQKPARVESAPLFRPEAQVNPEGGNPQMPEPTFTDRLNEAARRDEAARGKAKPAKRLLSRIAELGGISDRYAGELQDVKDARRIGVIRQKADMSPDVLARQLQSEGYDVDPEDLNTLWEAARRDIAGRDERTSNTAEIERRLAEEEAAYNERQSLEATAPLPPTERELQLPDNPTNRLREAEYEGGEVQRYSKPLEGQPVEREAFRPDTADLREVREFGKREPRTEQFTEEPPTAPLARRRQPIRPPAPASPRPVGNRPLSVDVAGTRTPTAMSPDFPRARREMIKQGREVEARLTEGQDKGVFGNVAEAMFKSNTPDVLHGQDSFFHDPDVKGKLGLTRDAEMADVRRELKTQLARSLGLSADEVSLSHIKPEVWRAWAKQKGLGREAVRKLEAGIARAERKQRAVETNAQIVAEESQRAQADVRAAKAKPADLEKQIKTDSEMTFDEFSASRGVSPSPPSFPQFHIKLGGVSKASEKSAARQVAEANAQWQQQRDDLRKEYDRAIASGEIKEPSRLSRLEKAAQGEGERAEAARRLLEKRQQGVKADDTVTKKRETAKPAPKSLDQQIKDIQSLIGWTIDEAEAKRQIAALEAQRPKIAERREAQPRTREDVENSPEFKRWFGDSKVVDESGKPLVVYHGSPSGMIDEFRVSRNSGMNQHDLGEGVYLTPSADEAAHYATGRGWGDNEKGTVYPVYVRLVKPFISEDPIPDDVLAAAQREAERIRAKETPTSREESFLEEVENITPETNMGDTLAFTENARRWRSLLISQGYDGGIENTGNKQIVAFEPSQIKSAIGNRGTFDPSSAKITERREAPGFFSQLERVIDAKMPAMRESVMQGQPKFRREVSGAMPERYTGRQLFENAQLTFRPARNRPATLVANDWGGAMLNRLLSEKLDVTTTDANFTIGAKYAKELRDYLADAKDSGIYEPAQVANMDAMLKQMDAAIADAEANQQDVAFVTRRPAEPISATKAKIRHETAHISQSRIAADLSALTGKNWLDSQPNAKDIHKELDRRGYAPKTHDYEAAAFVASGDYGVFGMNLDQAAKFLSDYFGAVVQKHGKRALQKFGAIDPRLQPVLEAARRETETGQTENQRGSIEIAPRGERRIGAADEARGGRASVLARRREGDTGDAGEAGRSPRIAEQRQVGYKPGQSSGKNTYNVDVFVYDLKGARSRTKTVKVSADNRPEAMQRAEEQVARSYPAIKTTGTAGAKDLSGYTVKALSAEKELGANRYREAVANRRLVRQATQVATEKINKLPFSKAEAELQAAYRDAKESGESDDVLDALFQAYRAMHGQKPGSSVIRAISESEDAVNYLEGEIGDALRLIPDATDPSPRITERKERPRFSFGAVQEGQGQVLASGFNVQGLFGRAPKEAKDGKPAPLPKDFDLAKWSQKSYTDALVNALSSKDRAEYNRLKTAREKQAFLFSTKIDPDLEAKVFKLIDRAAEAYEKGDGADFQAVRDEVRSLLAGQVSPSLRDVKWYDHLQSRLSNVNFKGTYERIAGEQGKEISEIFRNAQVDAANGKITRAEAVTRLQRELKPYIRRLKSSGKPGLARWVENHIDAVSAPDQSFKGLAGFLRGFQYNTKLRLNPRSALINTLQPFQTLWPHLTTAEWLRIQRDAAKPATWKRVSEVAARESGGSIEEVNDKKRFLGRVDLFSPVSEYNRIVGHLAGELFADRNGLTGDAKARMAADWAKKVEFDNSAYDIPPLFSGKIAGVVGQFKPFLVKNLERLYTDWKSAPPEALATNSWKGAGTIARRSKMITAQLLIGGVRSAIPGLKTIGGVLVLGGLAKAFSKFMDDDTAEKLAEAVYFGAPALVEQDLSGSVAVFDEPFGKTGYEKMVNFAGGPTLSLIAKAYEEGSAINEAKDSKTQTKSEKQKDAALRLAKAVTPYTKWGIAGAAAMRGERPSMWLGKEVPMTKAETIGYSLLGTPLRQSKYYEHKEAFDWQKGLMPERFEKEDKGTGTRILPDGKIDAGMIRQKVGEPEAIYKQRVQRVEGWMQEYGDKLLSHPSYSLLTESQKKAAMESLRRRIGAQQNAAQPKLGTLAPEKVIQSVLKSEATRPKRDAGKLWVSPATRP